VTPPSSASRLPVEPAEEHRPVAEVGREQQRAEDVVLELKVEIHLKLEKWEDARVLAESLASPATRCVRS
jgi:hypothetical protein